MLTIWSTITLFILTVANCVSESHATEWLYSTNDPDADRTPCQLIESRNFICEEHYVTTADGYILNLQRVVNPVFKAANKTLIKPIVLQHGLFGSATHFLTNAPGGFADDWTVEPVKADLTTEGRNLAMVLANYGYDVWLSNSRGNRFSKNHTRLNPMKDSSFWRFSFDEMIAYDVPAVIDYILKESGVDNLGWIGHSQGSLVMFGLLSEKPEYAAKVKPFIALAPVAHFEHITSPLRLITLVPGLMELMYTVGGELTIPQVLLDIMAEDVCDKTVIKEACGSVLFLVCGYDAAQFNFTRNPVYFSQGFGGTSTWDLLHFGQNIINKGFLKFDYGLLGNIEKYGSSRPPAYDLEAITSENIVLFSSDNDLLSVPEDIELLRKSLRVPFTEYIMEDPAFNHLDFLWAINVYEQLYKKLIAVLSEFN